MSEYYYGGTYARTVFGGSFHNIEQGYLSISSDARS
jgi:hypothetical protein